MDKSDNSEEYVEYKTPDFLSKGTLFIVLESIEYKTLERCRNILKDMLDSLNVYYKGPSTSKMRYSKFLVRNGDGVIVNTYSHVIVYKSEMKVVLDKSLECFNTKLLSLPSTVNLLLSYE